MKLVPVTVTDVPPAADPDGGDTPVTVGEAKYVKRSSLPKTFVPPGLVTVTSTMPADSAGAVAVMLRGTVDGERRGRRGAEFDGGRARQVGRR